MKKFELNHLQSSVLELMAQFPLFEKFYWTGGTALAYCYLQHRYSEDLDFFSVQQPYSFLEIHTIIEKIRYHISDIVEIQEQKVFERNVFIIKHKDNMQLKLDFLSLLSKKPTPKSPPYTSREGTLRGGLKIGEYLSSPTKDTHEAIENKEILISNKNILDSSDFLFFDYPSLDNKIICRNIKVDSLQDIAANKVLALMDRHEPKDVFDIYFLIKEKNYLPNDLLNWCNKKFHIHFPITNFIERALLAAQQLNNIQPYILYPNPTELIQNIIHYFEELSYQELRKRFFS